MMDNLSKKLKRKGRRRQSIIIGDLEKSSSEPDLTDFPSNPFTSNRWRKFDHESITVDELKFYRRRKPPGALNDLHTRSNICLYDNTEPTIPYSNLKTEYETVFCDHNKFNTSKSDLLRRDTTLNLNGPPMNCKSEQQSQYQPYDEEEILKNRSAIIKQRSENFALNNSDVLNQDEIIIDDYHYHHHHNNINSVNLRSTIPSAAANNNNNNNNIHANDYEMNKNDSQMCHLKLEGELNYLPEYRSQFIKFPQFERAHSIPQISSIKFQGNFVGLPEYRDSFKSYEQIAKSAPIKKPDNICIGNGNGNGYGIDISSGYDRDEYMNRYNKNLITTECQRTKSLKTDDHSIVNNTANEFVNGLPEYNESFKNPNITCMPERAKPRIGYLKLHGNIEYTPEYRCSYLDFPRARPITNKPISNFKLSNNPTIENRTTNNNNNNTTNLNHTNESIASSSVTSAAAPLRSRRPRRRSSREKFEPNPVLRNMIYHDSTQMTTDDQLPFFCQPEVRKAKKELMIKERSPSPQPLQKRKDIGMIETTPIIQPTDKNEIKSGNLSRKNSLKSSSPRNTSPTYKLMVENVDNPRGTFKKQTPKFGRRSSITGGNNTNYTGGRGDGGAGGGGNAHKLRNRTKIIEGNSNYISQKIDNTNLNNEKNVPSFIVLNEPCKQNAWMKPSWYS